MDHQTFTPVKVRKSQGAEAEDAQGGKALMPIILAQDKTSCGERSVRKLASFQCGVTSCRECSPLAGKYVACPIYTAAATVNFASRCLDNAWQAADIDMPFCETLAACGN